MCSFTEFLCSFTELFLCVVCSVTGHGGVMFCMSMQMYFRAGYLFVTIPIGGQVSCHTQTQSVHKVCVCTYVRVCLCVCVLRYMFLLFGFLFNTVFFFSSFFVFLFSLHLLCLVCQFIICMQMSFLMTKCNKT